MPAGASVLYPAAIHPCALFTDGRAHTLAHAHARAHTHSHSLTLSLPPEQQPLMGHSKPPVIEAGPLPFIYRMSVKHLLAQRRQEQRNWSGHLLSRQLPVRREWSRADMLGGHPLGPHSCRVLRSVGPVSFVPPLSHHTHCPLVLGRAAWQAPGLWAEARPSSLLCRALSSGLGCPQGRRPPALPWGPPGPAGREPSVRGRGLSALRRPGLGA